MHAGQDAGGERMEREGEKYMKKGDGPQFEKGRKQRKVGGTGDVKWIHFNLSI